MEKKLLYALFGGTTVYKVYDDETTEVVKMPFAIKDMVATLPLIYCEAEEVRDRWN